MPVKSTVVPDVEAASVPSVSPAAATEAIKPEERPATKFDPMVPLITLPRLI
jgi:hypothetical protein